MLRWQIHASIFVGVQLFGAIMLSLGAGFTGEPPFVSYGTALVSICLPIGAAYFAHACWHLRHADKIIRSIDYDWPRIRHFVIGALIIYLQIVSLTWHKALMPYWTTMWADPMLADLDLTLFGAEPYTLTMWLAPFWRVIDVGYSLWALAFKATFLFVLLSRSEKAGSVALAFILIVGLMGAWGQYLLPSGGPIFWERLGNGDRFDGLFPAANAQHAAAYLWLKYNGADIGFASGVSAFPSIHVATTTWMVIAAFLLFPRWKFPALAFFTLVLVGSVFLGWHYAVDGIAGVAGAFLCYGAAAWLLRNPRPAAAPSYALQSR